MAKIKMIKDSPKRAKADIPVEIRRFPSVRKIIVDTGEEGRQRHHMKALLELDVTVAHQKIAEIKRDTQAPFSFTGWLAYCIGRSIQEFPEVHGIFCGDVW